LVSPLSVGVKTERMEVERGELERLYREQGQRLWRAVFLFAGDRETASDAVAEAFAQAIRRGDAIRNLHAWVWQAAFRIAAGYLKERGRPLHVSEAPYESPLETMELRRALAALSAKQRAAVVLFYYADYSTKEVARLIESTPSAVGIHLHRARRKLRALLEVSDD
jgi:RNA polymerase sigma-70 factor, ECF subfamily